MLTAADILDRIGDAYYSLANDWTITFFNREAELFFGLRREEVEGQNIWQVFPHSKGSDLGAALRECMEMREPVQVRTWSSTLTDRWIDYRVFPLDDGGVAAMWRDETDRKRHEDALEQALQRQEHLYRELNHRVTNSLQAVASMLTLSSRGVEDGCAKDALTAAIDHVIGMSLVHKRLYRATGGIEEHDAGKYLSGLCDELSTAFHGTMSSCVVNARIDPGLMVSTDTMLTLGLMVSEMVMNAVKHASCATVGIGLRMEGEDVVLAVADDGVGLPEGFKPNKSSGLGMRLIHSWARQLHGRIEFQPRDGGGTKAAFTFPARNQVRVTAVP